ncbi:MAG: hypothetical protein ACE5NG_19175, partial [bacterium]
LFAVMKGDWEGSGFRFRWGLGYHLNPNLSLDAVFILPFTMALSGPFNMVHNNIRALNLGAGQDEDVLDVEKRITQVPGIKFELPGSIALGVSTRWDHYLASAVYIKYFDHIGYKLSYDQFDSVNVKIKGGDIHQGINLGSAFRVGIGVQQLMLGLGVVFGETFKEEITDPGTEPEIAEEEKIFLPIFSLGGGFRLGSRFRLDYVISPYNSSFLRFSTSYRL